MPLWGKPENWGKMATIRSSNQLNDKVLHVRPFQEDAREVLSGLREALAGLVSDLPAVTVRRPADLQRALNIDAKLSWQTTKVAGAADPLAAGVHVPGPGPMRKLLRAASKGHAPASRVEAAMTAYRAFEGLIERHAGDRSSFDSMISGYAVEEVGPIDLRHKRDAFRAQSHILGAQARSQLFCNIVGPSKTPGKLDILSVRGFADLRRLRPHASWVVARLRIIDDEAGKPRDAAGRRPLEVNKDVPEVGLLKDYCSERLPAVRGTRTASGFLNVELVGDAVGNNSAVTCFVGDIWQDAGSQYRTEDDHFVRTCAMVRTPSESLIHDVLVHEDLFGRVSPRVSVYSDVLGESGLSSRESDLLPAREEVRFLGAGVAALHCAEIPRYPEMADDVLGRVGWDPDRFHVYRCRVEFPVVPSSVALSFDLPEGD